MLKVFAVALVFSLHAYAQDTAILQGYFNVEGISMRIVRTKRNLCSSEQNIFLNITRAYDVIHSDSGTADWTVEINDFITRELTIKKTFTQSAGNNYTSQQTPGTTIVKSGVSGQYLVDFVENGEYPVIFITYDKKALTADSINTINSILQSTEGMEGTSLDVANADILGSKTYIP